MRAFVRFHAMQSTLVFGALCILWVVLQVLPILGVLVAVHRLPFVGRTWLLLMFKAFQGEKSAAVLRRPRREQDFSRTPA